MLEPVAGVQNPRRAFVRKTVSVGLMVAVTVAVMAVPSLVMAPTAQATLAARHLKLLRATPAADTVLSVSPDAICLWLSEPVQASLSKITLTNAAGANIALSAITIGAEKDAPLIAKVPSVLGKGAYTITWKTMSKDGHVVNGKFGFRVESPK